METPPDSQCSKPHTSSTPLGDKTTSLTSSGVPTMEKTMSAEQEVEIEVDESAVEYFAEVEMMQALSSKGKRGIPTS